MQRMSSKNEQLVRASTLFDGQCHQMSKDDFDLLASEEVRPHLAQWSLIRSAMRKELPARVDLAFSQKVMARINSLDESKSEETEQLPSMLASKSAFKAGLVAYAKNHEQQPISAVGAYEQEQNVGAYTPTNVGAYQPENMVDFKVTNVSSYEFETNVAYNQPLDSLQSNNNKRSVGWLNLKRVGVFASQIAIAASVAAVAVVGLQTYNASDITVENPASTAYTNNSAISGLSLASFTSNDSDVMVQLNNNMPDTAGTPEAKAAIKQQQQQEIERINLYLQGYILETAANK